MKPESKRLDTVPRRLFAVAIVGLACAWACGAVVATASAAPTDARAPNLTLYAYQRVFPAEATATFSLSTYNLRAVSLAAYAVDLEALIPNAAILDVPDDRRNPNSVLGRLSAMRLGKAAKTWTVKVKEFYPDEWVDQEIKLPKLASGVYIIEARGGGVASRTWLAVSRQALVVKRSPDVVKAWLVASSTGQPVEGVQVALYDAKGRAQVSRTSRDGTVTFAVPGSGAGAAIAATDAPVESVPLWVASLAGEPAFARASAPEPEKPYVAYVYTDRPVYRPGQLVRFRGTIRSVRRGAYSLPADRTVQVQIKARGDTVLYDERLAVNEWGTFSGDFQLAPEPPLGTYSLEVVLPGFRDYSSFEVEAYRKPEYSVTVSLPQPHVLGGTTFPLTISARYYFGSPVAGAKVSYSVHFEQMSDVVPKHVLTAAGLGSAAVTRMEEDFEGEGRLDADGRLTVAVATRSLPFDRELLVEAEVTDAAQRPRSAQGSTLVTAARFRMWLSMAAEQYQPGQLAEAIISACDYDDKPVRTTVTVSLIEHLTDREGRGYEQRTDQTVRTDERGRATAAFKVVRPGKFEVEAWTRDDEGNAVYARTYFYVSKEPPVSVWPDLETWLDKESYRPGDTAKLHVRTSLVGAWAMLTVEGERLYRCEIRRLLAKEFDLKIPVQRDYRPGVYVRLTIVRGGDMFTTTDQLSVPATDKRLNIVLAPDKDVYRPGETAVCDVTVTDENGAGVEAEVGLGVVDEALYAVRPDETADPMDVFWRAQADRVVADFSLAATYPGGGMQTLAEKALMTLGGRGGEEGQNGEGVRVRRLFVDTACWKASVVTGRDGRARVTFTVPDNLTTWRITARGLTAQTQVGQVRRSVEVTLPLLVRLTLPRFYVRGDKATVTAIVHNYTGTEREVRVTLAAEGARLADGADAVQLVSVPADGIRQASWPIEVIEQAGAAAPAGTAAAGTATASATAATTTAATTTGNHARFLVVADGGEGARDAVESQVPVLEDGTKRVDAVAGVSGESVSFEVVLPEAAQPGTAALELVLAPSLAGPLFEALDYLVQYPHGCAEQTMDRFLPNVIVARTLRELGVSRPEPPMLGRYVSFGVQKLLRYQHDDGGWHWWEFDDSDPYITAYVAYGLAMARDAGYPVAAGPLPRAIDYLRRALREEPDRSAACYLLWALASINRWDDVEAWQTAVAAARRLAAERGKLDVFSRASLAMALDRLNRRQPKTLADLGQAARSIAAELEQAAVVSGTAAHWTAGGGNTGTGSWLDSDVEATSQVLQALLALKPDSTRIVPAVRWLMAARRGKAWNSTKDTAAAVLALSHYLRQARELEPDEAVTVYIEAGRQGDADGGAAVSPSGGVPAGTMPEGRMSAGTTVRFTREDVFGDPARVVVPGDALRPGVNVVRLDKVGDGNLYWSARLSYVVPAQETEAPLTRGIGITRRYRVFAENPITAGQQPVGNLIEVTVDLAAAGSYRYAMLEEPIPAGCEVVQGDEEYGDDEYWGGVPYDRREVWDDRIVYYFDYLRKGETTVSYWLRSEAAGTYRVRPSSASLMYFPEVRGEARPAKLMVVE